MKLEMASAAQPSHLKRLIVVLVVHLGVLAAAVSTGQFGDLAAAQVDARIAAAIVLLALAMIQGIPSAPFAHVGRMTWAAKSLPWTVALASA